MSDDTDVPAMVAPQAYATAVMGPNQAGYQAQLMVYSVFVCLFFMYWQSGELKNHNKAGRFVLWIALFLNSVYTGFEFYECYVSSVSQDRTVFRLANGNVIWNVIPVLSGLIAALTEGFLAMRAASLLPKKPLRYVFSAWMTLLIVGVLVGGCLTTYAGLYYNFHEDSDTEPFMNWNAACSLFLWASAVADLSISTALAFVFRSRIAGFNEATDSLLRRLALIAWRTASYTTVLSIISAIILSVYSVDDDLGSYVAQAFWQPMSGLYGIALFTFASSSRRAIHSSLNPLVKTSYQLPQYRPVTPTTGSVPLPPALPTNAGKEEQEASTGSKSSAEAGRSRNSLERPLQVVVKQESSVMYDNEDEEEEGFGGGGGKKRSVGGLGMVGMREKEEARSLEEV